MSEDEDQTNAYPVILQWGFWVSILAVAFLGTVALFIAGSFWLVLASLPLITVLTWAGVNDLRDARALHGARAAQPVWSVRTESEPLLGEFAALGEDQQWIDTYIRDPLELPARPKVSLIKPVRTQSPRSDGHRAGLTRTGCERFYARDRRVFLISHGGQVVPNLAEVSITERAEPFVVTLSASNILVTFPKPPAGQRITVHWKAIWSCSVAEPAGESMPAVEAAIPQTNSARLLQIKRGWESRPPRGIWMRPRTNSDWYGVWR